MNPKLLVYCLDDEPDLLDMFQMSLENAGMICEIFQDHQKLLQKITKNPPSVVTLDIRMPDISGLEVLELIRKVNVQVPVVLISGHLSKEDLVNYRHHGNFTTLEKPFKASRLVSAIVEASQSTSPPAP